MSDLVPFVAAVLRDKTVADLHEELKAEKERNKKLENELQLVCVTGPGGFPVYAERRFKYAKTGVYCMNADDEFTLELQNSTGKRANTDLPSCPVRNIENCEIRIGGKKVLRIGDYDDVSTLGTVGDTNCCVLYKFDSTDDWRHNIYLQVDYGPNPDPELTEILDPDEYRNEDITYVRFTEFETKGNPFED